MYIMKNTGPNKEPYGTPEVTVNQSDASPLTTTPCGHSVK